MKIRRLVLHIAIICLVGMAGCKSKDSSDDDVDPTYKATGLGVVHSVSPDGLENTFLAMADDGSGIMLTEVEGKMHIVSKLGNGKYSWLELTTDGNPLTLYTEDAGSVKFSNWTELTVDVTYTAEDGTAALPSKVDMKYFKELHDYVTTYSSLNLTSTTKEKIIDTLGFAAFTFGAASCATAVTTAVVPGAQAISVLAALGCAGFVGNSVKTLLRKEIAQVKLINIADRTYQCSSYSVKQTALTCMKKGFLELANMIPFVQFNTEAPLYVYADVQFNKGLDVSVVFQPAFGRKRYFSGKDRYVFGSISHNDSFLDVIAEGYKDAEFRLSYTATTISIETHPAKAAVASTSRSAPTQMMITLVEDDAVVGPVDPGVKHCDTTVDGRKICIEAEGMTSCEHPITDGECPSSGRLGGCQTSVTAGGVTAYTTTFYYTGFEDVLDQYRSLCTGSITNGTWRN